MYVVMRCIVLGRQMNVHFSICMCINTIPFVGMNVRFCATKIHDSLSIRIGVKEERLRVVVGNS